MDLLGLLARLSWRMCARTAFLRSYRPQVLRGDSCRLLQMACRWLHSSMFHKQPLQAMQAMHGGLGHTTSAGKLALSRSQALSHIVHDSVQCGDMQLLDSWG